MSIQAQQWQVIALADAARDIARERARGERPDTDPEQLNGAYLNGFEDALRFIAGNNLAPTPETLVIHTRYLDNMDE